MASTSRFTSRALRLMALMMGSRYNVNIAWDPKAETASTDGKKITLPTLAHTGNQEDAELLEGLFDHEVGHCRFTDFSMLNNMKESSNAFWHSVHNSIEDVYEERRMGEVYPGCKKSLRRVEEIFINRDMYKHNSQLDPVNALNIGIYSMLRMNVLEHPSKAVLDAVQPQMIAHFGQEMTEKVLEIAARTAFAKSTGDTIQITQAIIDLVKDSIKESEKNQQQGQQGQSGQPKDGTGQGGQPGSQPQQSGQQGGVSGKKDGKKQKNGSQGQPGQQSQQQGQDPAPVDNLTQQQVQALQSALDAAKGDIMDISVDSNAVKALDNNGAVRHGGGNSAGSAHDVNIAQAKNDSSWRQNVMASSQQLFVRMGSKLEVFLEAIKESNEWATLSGRKVVRDYNERLDSGNFKVFRRKEDSQEIDTAVSILVDYSGSMESDFSGKTRMDAAWDACFAIGKVMYQHDVPFSITGFAGDICHLKDFEGGLNAIKFPSGNTGATMTHEGVLAAGYPLACRDENKKLMVVITDGIPSSSSDATAAIREIIGNGVNVAVVFIDDSHSSQQFGDALVQAGCTYASAGNPDDLSSAVFSAVKQSMRI